MLVVHNLSVIKMRTFAGFPDMNVDSVRFCALECMKDLVHLSQVTGDLVTLRQVLYISICIFCDGEIMHTYLV